MSQVTYVYEVKHNIEITVDSQNQDFSDLKKEDRFIIDNLINCPQKFCAPAESFLISVDLVKKIEN